MQRETIAQMVGWMLHLFRDCCTGRILPQPNKNVDTLWMKVSRSVILISFIKQKIQSCLGIYSVLENLSTAKSLISLNFITLATASNQLFFLHMPSHRTTSVEQTWDPSNGLSRFAERPTYLKNYAAEFINTTKFLSN